MLVVKPLPWTASLTAARGLITHKAEFEEGINIMIIDGSVRKLGHQQFNIYWLLYICHALYLILMDLDEAFSFFQNWFSYSNFQSIGFELNKTLILILAQFFHRCIMNYVEALLPLWPDAPPSPGRLISLRNDLLSPGQARSSLSGQLSCGVCGWEFVHLVFQSTEDFIIFHFSGNL